MSKQTRIGYDFKTQQLLIGRPTSGNVGFVPSFAGVYRAPQAPTDGNITMRSRLVVCSRIRRRGRGLGDGSNIPK